MNEMGGDSRSKFVSRQSNIPFGRSVYQSTYYNLFPTAYNPYQAPASVKLAEDHASATKFGRTVDMTGAQLQDYCQCCKNLIDTDPFTWRAGIEAIGYETSEYAMYFYFLIFGFFWLLFLFLLVGINSLAHNYVIRKTFISIPDSTTYSDASLISEFQANRVARGITGIVAVVCFAFFRRMFMIFLQKRNEKFEASKITPALFTVRLKTPFEVYKTDEDIERDLKSLVGNSSLRVVNINRVYNIREYSQTLLKLMNIQKQLRTKFAKFGRDFSDREELEQKNLDYLRRFRVIKAGFSRQSGIAHMFAHYVFVTFATPRERAEVERTFQKTWGFRRPELQGYKCYFAPEPKNVIWDNYGLSAGSKLMRRLVTYVVAVLIIAANFGIILGIRVAQYSSTTGVTSTGKLWINLLMSVIIAGFNIAILILLQYITKFEQRTTYSSDQSNKILKVSVAMFLNQAVVNLVTSLLATVIQGDAKGVPVADWRLWTETGVMNGTVLIFLITLGVHLIDPFLYFGWIYRLIRKAILTRRVNRAPSSNKVLQAELNESYECVQFDLINGYSCYFRNLASAMFYAVVLPYGLLLSMAMMALQFLVSYLEIIYVRGKEQNFDFDFTENMGNILPFCNLMFTVGLIVFEAITAGQVSGFVWAAFAISLVDWAIDTLVFLAKPWRGGLSDSDLLYAQYQFTFPENYDRLNPITQVPAFARWIKEMDLRNRNPNTPESQLAFAARSQLLQTSRLPRPPGPRPPDLPGSSQWAVSRGAEGFPGSSQWAPSGGFNAVLPGSIGAEQKPDEAFSADIMQSLINYTLSRPGRRTARAEIHAPVFEVDDEEEDPHADINAIDIYKTQKLIHQELERNSRVSVVPQSDFAPKPFQQALSSIFPPPQTPEDRSFSALPPPSELQYRPGVEINLAPVPSFTERYAGQNRHETGLISILPEPPRIVPPPSFSAPRWPLGASLRPQAPPDRGLTERFVSFNPGPQPSFQRPPPDPYKDPHPLSSANPPQSFGRAFAEPKSEKEFSAQSKMTLEDHPMFSVKKINISPPPMYTSPRRPAPTPEPKQYPRQNF